MNNEYLDANDGGRVLFFCNRKREESAVRNRLFSVKIMVQ
jgi:hypothetical protein